MFQGSTPALELSFTTAILPASEAMRKIRDISDICVTYLIQCAIRPRQPPASIAMRKIYKIPKISRCAKREQEY